MGKGGGNKSLTLRGFLFILNCAKKKKKKAVSKLPMFQYFLGGEMWRERYIYRRGGATRTFLWHLLRQNLNTLASLRTNVIPIVGVRDGVFGLNFFFFSLSSSPRMCQKGGMTRTNLWMDSMAASRNNRFRCASLRVHGFLNSARTE